MINGLITTAMTIQKSGSPNLASLFDDILNSKVMYGESLTDNVAVTFHLLEQNIYPETEWTVYTDYTTGANQARYIGLTDTQKIGVLWCVIHYKNEPILAIKPNDSSSSSGLSIERANYGTAYVEGTTGEPDYIYVEDVVVRTKYMNTLNFSNFSVSVPNVLSDWRGFQINFTFSSTQVQLNYSYNPQTGVYLPPDNGYVSSSTNSTNTMTYNYRTGQNDIVSIVTPERFFKIFPEIMREVTGVEIEEYEGEII